MYNKEDRSIAYGRYRVISKHLERLNREEEKIMTLQITWSFLKRTKTWLTKSVLLGVHTRLA